MRLTAACAAWLCIALVAPTWCDEEAAAERHRERGHYYAMAGQFWPTQGGYSGSAAVGVQYLVRASGTHFGLEYTRSFYTGIAAGVPTELEVKAIGAIIGAREWRGRWYFGGGAGIARVEREVGTVGGVATEHSTEGAWNLAVGTLFGKRGLAELRYVDAGDDGARGFAGFVGIRF